MKIRTEIESDHTKVFQVNYLAFDNKDDEALLVERIRGSEHFITELSLVAEQNNEIVGHALFSEAYVMDGQTKHKVIVLAPIAVMPSYQKQGIGRLLIQEGLKRSKELGYHYVMLIGHPEYYPKFGFEPAMALGFELKQFAVPDDVFMVHPLAVEKENTIQGELIYPAAFFG